MLRSVTFDSHFALGMKPSDIMFCPCKPDLQSRQPMAYYAKVGGSGSINPKQGTTSASISNTSIQHNSFED